jgi:serine protease Do
MQGSGMLKMFLVGAAVAAAAAVAVTSARAQGAGRPGPGDRVFAAPVFPVPDAGQIGVSIRNVGDDDLKTLKLANQAGAIVETVQPNSPASSAGLRANDVIVEFDGEHVRSVRQLTRLVLETPPGRHVKVGVMRDGRRSDLELTPRAVPPGAAFQSDALQQALEGVGRLGGGTMAPRGRLGVSIQPLGADLASYFGVRNGVLVASVVSDSAAARAGLKAGDVITAVDGKSVTTTAELTSALGDPNTAREVTLTVVRDKKELALKAKLAGAGAPAARTPGPRGV